MTQDVSLSEFQRRALDAMGVQLWTPRRDLPFAGPVEWPVVREQIRQSPEEDRTPADESNVRADAIRSRLSPSLEQSTEALGPAIKFQSLSLRSGGCHMLIDDATYAEGAFWRDVLRSLRGFGEQEPVRENRFDWPLPGLQDASAEAAQKALLGYLNQDKLVCVRGDGLANLLIGAGKWQSFPERQTLADAEIWVFGSDSGLKDVETRRAIWKSIAGLRLS